MFLVVSRDGYNLTSQRPNNDDLAMSWKKIPIIDPFVPVTGTVRLMIHDADLNVLSDKIVAVKV